MGRLPFRLHLFPDVKENQYALLLYKNVSKKCDQISANWLTFWLTKLFTHINFCLPEMFTDYLSIASIDEEMSSKL